MGLEEYLEIVSSQIRNKRARVMAVKEIEDHIKDQAGVYEEAGMEQKAAVQKAVYQMGDPVTTGVELDRIHRPKMEWKLFWWIVLFSALGLLVQYLCFYGLGSTGEQIQTVPDFMGNFIKQCFYTAAGLAVMAVVCLCDYSLIGKYGGILGACFLGGISLMCFSGILRRVNGSYFYIKCLQYLFIPLYGGILYKNRGKGYKGIGICFLWIAALFLVGLRVIGGGFGVTIHVVAVCFFMLLFAVWEEWFQISKKAGFGFTAAVLVMSGILFLGNLAPYQKERIQVSLHPENYAGEAGYQVITIRNIVSNLKINTSCYGTLEQKGLLPLLSEWAVQYEYMFLQAAVTLGVWKTVCLGILFAAFLLYLFRMAVREKNKLGQMIGLGCTMLLTVETIQNILCNFGIGIISTSGIPFFSYGKMHTIVVYMLFGILLSIYRYQNLVWEKPIKETQKRGELAKIGDYVLRVEKREKTLTSR